MKREIKFKAKLKEGLYYIDGKVTDWVSGYVFYIGNKYFIQNIFGEEFEIDENTISEFTGLYCPDKEKGFGKDGNYKELIPLYENDIVEFQEEAQYYDYYGYSVKKGDRFICSFCEGGFVLVPEKIYEDWDKSGRIPSMCKVMRNYDVWNNHGHFIPVSNLFNKIKKYCYERKVRIHKRTVR